jgi:FlaA1/EpsC-like NDP-sugar epimerase
MLARRFEAARSWMLDLVLANGIFFALSALYLWIRLDAFYLHLGPKAWGWHVALSVWLLAGLGGAGVYYRRMGSDLGKILLGLAGGASGFLITGFFFKNAVFSRAAFLLSTLGVSATLLVRHLRRHAKAAARPRRLLVLGVGEDSRRTLERLRQWPRRFLVLGYVDAEAEGLRPSSVPGDMPIAELSSLEPMVKALEVDALVLPAAQASELLPRLPHRLAGLRVFVEVEAGSGPPLLGDVTLDRSTIAGGQ